MTSTEKRLETLRKNREARKRRAAELRPDDAASAAALRAVRDNPKSAPEARLRAVELLRELRERGRL